MTEYMVVDLWPYTFFISALCGGGVLTGVFKIEAHFISRQERSTVTILTELYRIFISSLISSYLGVPTGALSSDFEAKTLFL